MTGMSLDSRVKATCVTAIGISGRFGGTDGEKKTAPFNGWHLGWLLGFFLGVPDTGRAVAERTEVQ